MRRNAWGECHRTASRKRLAYPSLLIPPVTAPPKRRRPSARPPKTSPYMRQQFLRVGLCRIVERHRAIGLAVDELPHVRILGGAHFVRGAAGDDPSFGHEA